MSENIGNATRSLHADDVLNVVTDVAPPMHLSTTFRYPDDPEASVPYADLGDVRCIPLFLPSSSRIASPPPSTLVTKTTCSSPTTQKSTSTPAPQPQTQLASKQSSPPSCTAQQ